MLLAVLALAAPAVAPDPSQVAQVFARQTQTVTERVHLIYKPDVVTPPFEGNVVVIEQSVPSARPARRASHLPTKLRRASRPRPSINAPALPAPMNRRR